MRNDRGQLTIGLAIAFTTVLAMFGMMLRYGLVTREKMKLQQTSDLAALAASRTQFTALNTIRELNQEIEQQFDIAQTALLTLGSPCFIKQGFGGLSIYQASILASIYGLTKTEGDEGENSDLNPCDQGCNGFDADWRNKIIRHYSSNQKKVSARILAIILEANPEANQNALYTFLTPANLPFRLQQRIHERFGSSITREQLVNEYVNGRLPELNIIEDGRKFPLFVPKLEHRIITYNRYHYLTSPLLPGQCTIAGLPQTRPASTRAKVVRDGEYKSSFYTGAFYDASDQGNQKDETERYNLNVKNAADNGEFGKEIRSAEGKKINLFRSRLLMKVMAMAKPYGGTFPEAKEITTALNRGTVGEKFEGSKLIGLADQENEIGGEFYNLSESWPTNVDAQGKPTESIAWTTKDYLH